MRYDDRPEIDATYAEIARLYERHDDAEQGMALSNDLVARGEDSSWASVWWAYGAVHHDLSDEAYARALELLSRVDRPDEARAAALMLTAEIESTQAFEAGATPDPARQAELLSEARSIAPAWPSVRLRLAYSLRDLGDVARSSEEAKVALALIDSAEPTTDPFDTAITGLGIDRGYVAAEVQELATET